MKQQFEIWFAQEFGGEPKTAEEIVFKDSLFMAWSAGRSDAQEQLENAQREFRSADITMQNLEAKYERLAAENAGLKAEQVRIFNSGYQRGHEATVEGYYVDIHQNDITTYHEDIVAEIEEEQTPATDAFLAEVRASELDSLAGVAETMLVKFSNQRCSSDMHEVVGWKKVLQQASNRAAQLRKGAAL